MNHPLRRLFHCGSVSTHPRCHTGIKRPLIHFVKPYGLGGIAHTPMIARTLTLVVLALILAGCRTLTAPNDASQWTIDLASSEALPSGPCRIYDEVHRLMLEGTLAAGKMDGTWTSFGSDGGRLSVLSYRGGVLNGPVQMWYGFLAYPEARGRLKLEGAFVDGVYDGTVTRYYPSGARQSVRVYNHGLLKSSRYWSLNGTERSAPSSEANAEFELKADMNYMAAQEGMVARSLAQANRNIAK